MIADLFSWLGGILWDAIKWVFGGIAKLLGFLIDLIINFFEAIFDVIKGVLYLLYMIGVLAVKFFQVIFETAKVLWSLIQGFGRTLASLSYSPRSSSGNGYSETLGRLFKELDKLQIEPIAYILLFMLWFITAISAIKLISSIRVGGD